VSRIGYFEGTDPLLLAKFAIEGIDMLPVANAWDGHGKYVNKLSKGEVNVVVGYMHKVVPAALEPTKTIDLLFTCVNLEIPIVLIVPPSYRERAKKMLGDLGPNVHFAAPEELEAQIRKYL
jgi:hypothetical protein